MDSLVPSIRFIWFVRCLIRRFLQLILTISQIKLMISHSWRLWSVSFTRKLREVLRWPDYSQAAHVVLSWSILQSGKIWRAPQNLLGNFVRDVSKTTQQSITPTQSTIQQRFGIWIFVISKVECFLAWFIKRVKTLFTINSFCPSWGCCKTIFTRMRNELFL